MKFDELGSPQGGIELQRGEQQIDVNLPHGTYLLSPYGVSEDGSSSRQIGHPQEYSIPAPPVDLAFTGPITLKSGPGGLLMSWQTTQTADDGSVTGSYSKIGIIREVANSKRSSIQNIANGVRTEWEVQIGPEELRMLSKAKAEGRESEFTGVISLQIELTKGAKNLRQQIEFGAKIPKDPNTVKGLTPEQRKATEQMPSVIGRIEGRSGRRTLWNWVFRSFFRFFRHKGLDERSVL